MPYLQEKVEIYMCNHTFLVSLPKPLCPEVPESSSNRFILFFHIHSIQLLTLHVGQSENCALLPDIRCNIGHVFHNTNTLKEIPSRCSVKMNTYIEEYLKLVIKHTCDSSATGCRNLGRGSFTVCCWFTQHLSQRLVVQSVSLQDRIR